MSRTLPRFHQTEAARQARISRILLESSGEVKMTSSATAGGDRRQLRGIPVIGGVSGTMPGTQPGAKL